MGKRKSMRTRGRRQFVRVLLFVGFVVFLWKYGQQSLYWLLDHVGLKDDFNTR